MQLQLFSAVKHSALNAVKYEYKKYREKNYAVHGEVLSAVNTNGLIHRWLSFRGLHQGTWTK